MLAVKTRQLVADWGSSVIEMNLESNLEPKEAMVGRSQRGDTKTT